MAILPDKSLTLWDGFAPVFTRPTFQRFLVLMGTAILTTGRCTVANLLRIAGSLTQGHISSYRRVFSKASRSQLRLALALARSLLTYGEARHRDPVRSSHTFTAWRYGHKWVVLAMLVRFLFANRPLARLTLVSKLHPEANLFEPPPSPITARGDRPSRGNGNPSRAKRFPPPGDSSG